MQIALARSGEPLQRAPELSYRSGNLIAQVAKVAYGFLAVLSFIGTAWLVSDVSGSDSFG